MKYLIRTIIYFISVSTFSQNIEVKDIFSLSPIPEVFVFDIKKEKIAVSDSMGVVNIENFEKNSTLQFKHIAYKALKIQKNNISQNQNIFLTPNSEKLNEIVLSVSRSSYDKNRLAKEVKVINNAQIKRLLPENTSSILNQIPGIRVQQSHGGGGSPVLRGFEANRILLVIDGVRVNNAIFRSGHLHNSLSIDPLFLERTEVMFGPSSVGYGSDAIGGVIHFYSKEPLTNEIRKTDFSFSTSKNFGQNISKNAFLFEHSNKKFALLQSFSFSRFGDIIMGKKRYHGHENWGKVFYYSQNTDTKYYPSPTINSNPNVQKNTNYNQFDLLQKFVYKPSNNYKLLLNFQLSRSSNIARFDKLNQLNDDKLKYARWEYGPQKRVLVSPQLLFFSEKDWIKSGKIILSLQTFSESRIHRKFNELTRKTQKEEVQVYSLNGDFRGNIFKTDDLSYGVEVTHNSVESNAFSQEIEISENKIISLSVKTPITTRYPSDGSQYLTLAGYVDYRKKFNNATLNLGFRHTYNQLKALWHEKALIDASLNYVFQKNQSSNFSLGYNYEINKRWSLKSIFSTGFRAPNIDDLGKTRENNGILSIPNTNLKSEYIYNIDFGINRKWINGSSVNLTSYFSIVNDYIGRGLYSVINDITTENPSTILFSGDEVTTIANLNLGQVKLFGAEIVCVWNVSSKIDWKSNITFTKGEGNSLTGNLPSISPVFLSQKINVSVKRGDLFLKWDYSFSKNSESFSPWGEDRLEETPLIGESIYAGTPRWSRFDINFEYPISNRVFFSAALNNIFDSHYREFASGISSHGRSLRVALKYEM